MNAHCSAGTAFLYPLGEKMEEKGAPCREDVHGAYPALTPS